MSQAARSLLRSRSSPTGQASVWLPLVRLANTEPPRLSGCLPDPRTWGAIQTQAATYIDPRSAGHAAIPDTRMNEYLLQYHDPSSAHQAFLNAFRQAKSCVKGGEAPPQRWAAPPHPSPRWDGCGYNPRSANGVRALRFDEGFGQQWNEAALGIAPTNRQTVLRVARAGNVLVVIEDATMDDKNEVWLSNAVYQALPQYTWHRPTRPQG